MRKVLGYVLFVLGLTFVFLSPFLLFYTVPRVEKAPTDIDQTVTSDGAGSYFSAQKLQLAGPVPMEAIERFKGSPQASTDDVVVINYQQHTFVTTAGNDIDFDKEVFAMNRSSGEAEHCCGETPRHSGLELKFPFDAQKTTYQLWDAASDKAYPARFVGEDTINGTTVYRYHQETGDVQTGFLDLPGTVIGQPAGNVETERMYNASIDAWVEPVTGAIVKGRKAVKQWAALDGKPVLVLADITVTYNPPTVDKLVSDAAKNAKQLTLIKTTLPIVLPILGILLAGGGLLLLLRKPKERPVPGTTDAEPAKDGTAKPKAVAGPTTTSPKPVTSPKPAKEPKPAKPAEPVRPAEPVKPAEA